MRHAPAAAAALGCGVEDVAAGADVGAFGTAYLRARARAAETRRPVVVVCPTHPSEWTGAGAWWVVGVPGALTGESSAGSKARQTRWL